jgi:hypothetical protein
MIETYAVTGTEVHMYEKALVTVAGHRGAPVQQVRLLPVKWESVKLNAAQVQGIAAKHEWNESGKVIQLAGILKVV